MSEDSSESHNEGPENATPSEILGLVRASLSTPSFSATGQVRMNYSIQHLMGATQLARWVGQLQAENRERPFGPFFDDLLGASVGCIVLAVASAEAYVNELFVDRRKWFPNRDHMLLDILWSEFERKSLLEKYDLASLLATGSTLDRGSDPVQAFECLVQLRNGLTHFRPEWPSEAYEHRKLSQRLNDRAVRSPWLRNEELFPRAWASHGTATWAVTTVLKHIEVFSSISGLENRFRKHLERFDLEPLTPFHHPHERA